MAHPLSGANPSVLRDVLAQAGAVDGAKLAPIRAAVLGRRPFTILEEATHRKLRTADEMPAPVFILGHWRSGTTHLYNLMSLAGFGYVPPIATGLPGEMLTLGRWLRPFLERQLPDSRYIDNVPVTPTSPQEDEIALANLSPLSFYHGIYFPRRFGDFVNRGVFHDGVTAQERAGWERAFLTFMGKLDRWFDGRPLLIKNPVYTARPAHIRQLFPRAKFIHIHRDPFDVFPSMQNFYRKLFPVMALQPWQELDVDEAVFSVYDRMMARFAEETADWKSPDFVEVGYRELSEEPIRVLEDIYTGLELEGFADARSVFEGYLEGIADYRKNSFRKADHVTETISERWASWLDRWGYERPR